ncbi:MAG: hypothetical protein Q4D16_10700 [Eubacteriales bacterium]|nr:hypothetical protein [Eubacteriales bacterium]
MKNNGYKAFDLTTKEEIQIHSPNKYVDGEIIELKCPDCVHECKILETLSDDSDD